MAIFLQIVAGLSGLLISWYAEYNSAASVAERKLKDIKHDDEKLRKECLELDADAISVRINDILHPPCGDTTGQRDDNTEKGRTST